MLFFPAWHPKGWPDSKKHKALLAEALAAPIVLSTPVTAQTVPPRPGAVVLESEISTVMVEALKCIANLQQRTNESVSSCESAAIKQENLPASHVTPDVLRSAIDKALKCVQGPKPVETDACAASVGVNCAIMDCAQDVAKQVVAALGVTNPPLKPVPQAPPAEKQGRMYMGATVYGPDPWRKPQSAITFISKMCNEVSDRECANAYEVFTLCNAYSTAEPPPDTSTREAMTEGINLKFQACMHEYMQ
jgi:hypothetical protein